TDAKTDTQITELKAALADARAELDEREEAHARQIIRFEDAIAGLSDARGLSSERDRLHKLLSVIVEFVAESRGLMRPPAQNRGVGIVKIARAEKLATAALKPAKVPAATVTNDLAA